MIAKPVYALVKDLSLAGRMVKSAQASGVPMRTFDTSQRLLEACKAREPALVILDADRLEREAFQALQGFRSDEKFRKVPAVGFAAGAAQALIRELKEAGCLQVYQKTELFKGLNDLFMRYAYGIPPGI